MTNMYQKFNITINSASKGWVAVKATSSETAEETAMKIVKAAHKCKENDTILLSLVEIEEK